MYRKTFMFRNTVSQRVHNAIIQIMLVIMENACYVQFRKVFFFLFYCVANIAFQVQKSPLTLCFKWTKLTVNPAL